MPIKLVKINKLIDLKQYENPERKNDSLSSRKKRTKNVPLLLIDNEGRLINSKRWVYTDNNDELVYDIKKNLWAQGAEYYDIGKSHIKEVYVAVKADAEAEPEPARQKTVDLPGKSAGYLERIATETGKTQSEIVERLIRQAAERRGLTKTKDN